jgi:IclR family KDG regulon transcriptional repressor
LTRTRRTITDVEALRGELHSIRADQLAYDREEAAIGLRCVAAPTIGDGGAVTAALSVSMPIGGRLAPAEVVPAVRTVARAL